MNVKLETQPHRVTRIIKKAIFAIIIGLGFFLGGLFCALISPFVAVLSLLYTPTANVAQKFKSWEEGFKELQDPDYKEKWKKDHDDLYNEDNPENRR